MKVLLTNDDGVDSEGIRLLAIELQKYYDVYVVAPDSEKSATSQAITLRRPVELKRVELEGVINPVYSLEGTPADCVRVGVSALYDDIDIVFSGINRGFNAGADIQYSGTVSACQEANLFNLSGVAVSTEFKDNYSNFELASKPIYRIFERFKDIVTSEPMVLNINVPNIPEEQIKGVQLCKLGGLVHDSYTIEEKSEDTKIVKLKERIIPNIAEETDQRYLKLGFITVTPIKYNFYSEPIMNKFLDNK